MGMDPKQERALRDGTAVGDDEPRQTDRESVREQEEHPPVPERARPRRRTAAVPDVRVNLESGTPVERLARELGAEPVPEMGRARDRDNNGGRSGEPESAERDLAGPTPEAAPEEARRPARREEEIPVKPGEARRTLKARREHSKGDGNFPRVEPGPEMLDERPEDRQPRDLPKARDDRSAPKGNITVGQDDRNPDLAVRDDHQAPSPQVFAVAPRRIVEPKRTPSSAASPRMASPSKRTLKVAAGAKRTRAGRKPPGAKTNVRRRPATRATTTRRPTKAARTATKPARRPTKAARKAPPGRGRGTPARRAAKLKRKTGRR